jgi:hypothetical protein
MKLALGSPAAHVIAAGACPRLEEGLGCHRDVNGNLCPRGLEMVLEKHAALLREQK